MPSGFQTLPPLHSLAAFEAVARLQSFARAADELCITHGAVSHRIKLLERHFGTSLLVRRGGHVTLTTNGSFLLSAVLDALSTLQNAANRVSVRRRVVTVNAGPSTARCWLMPRLGNFYKEHSDIDLEVSSSQLTKQNRRASLEAGEVDVTIRYSRKEEWDGLKCQKLMDVNLFPVCAPTYHRALGSLRSEDDLRHAVFLRLPREPWRPWFEAAGLDWPEPVSGPLFGDASLMLEAAVNGQGIALARSVLVDQELAGGRLVRLLEIAIPSPRAYYGVCSKRAAARPEVRRFMQWLVSACRCPVEAERPELHRYPPRLRFENRTSD